MEVEDAQKSASSCENNLQEPSHLTRPSNSVTTAKMITRAAKFDFFFLTQEIGTVKQLSESPCSLWEQELGTVTTCLCTGGNSVPPDSLQLFLGSHLHT